MNGRYLLDTNIAIAIVEKRIDFRDRPRAQGFLSTTRDGHFEYVDDLMTEHW